MEVQQSSISLQMPSPKHMDIKVNSNLSFNCESPNHTSAKTYFANTYQMLSGSPNTLNKMTLNSYSISPVKKSIPIVRLMDSETVQNTKWNNYSNSNINCNIKNSNSNSVNKTEIDFINNLNGKSNIKDVLNNINNKNKNFNDNSNINNSFDNTISSASNNNNFAQENSNDFFSKKSVKNHFENKTNDKNVSQLSYQLSKATINHNNNSCNSNEREELDSNSNDNKLSKPINNNFNKSIDTEAIADIVFKKQEAHEAEKMNANAKTSEKIEIQKSLYSCQLSLSPKEKVLESLPKNKMSMNFNNNNKKVSLTMEDFESTKVIKENARKMLLANEPRKPKVVRKPRTVKFSGENEECPFKRFEAPVSVVTSPIFLVNSNIQPFLETRCNLTTFSEFKQRMIIKKPILVEKAGLLIEESENDNVHLANFIKNNNIKKEHGVFKARPSHIPYGTSSTSYPLITSRDKDKIRVVVQVQNLAFEKEVYIRYTFNNWKSSKDVPATYLNSLNVTSYISKKFHESTSIYSYASRQEKMTTGIDDSESKIVSQSVDRFVADIEIPSYIADFMDYDHNFFNHHEGHEHEGGSYIRDRRRYSQSLGEEWDNDIVNRCTLKFAAFYRVNGQEYWENNNSLNFTVDISRVLYIPTKRVYIRSRTPEAINSRMVNFTDAFYNVPKSKKESELKSILKRKSKAVDSSSSSNPASSVSDESVIAQCELREKTIHEAIKKEFSGSKLFKQIGINPTILNTIINSNRDSSKNSIIKMIMYYQRKAGISCPIIPLERETSIKVESQ